MNAIKFTTEGHLALKDEVGSTAAATWVAGSGSVRLHQGRSGQIDLSTKQFAELLQNGAAILASMKASDTTPLTPLES